MVFIDFPWRHKANKILFGIHHVLVATEQ